MPLKVFCDEPFNEPMMELAVDDVVGSDFDDMVLDAFDVMAEADKAPEDIDELNPLDDSPPDIGKPIA